MSNAAKTGKTRIDSVFYKSQSYHIKKIKTFLGPLTIGRSPFNNLIEYEFGSNGDFEKQTVKLSSLTILCQDSTKVKLAAEGFGKISQLDLNLHEVTYVKVTALLTRDDYNKILSVFVRSSINTNS